MDGMTEEAIKLLGLINQLGDIGNRGVAREVIGDWLSKPTHQQHQEKFQEIQRYALRHLYAAVELIVMGKVTLSYITTFLFSSTVDKEHNPHLIDFFAAVDSVSDKISESDRVYLKWLHDVHGY